MGITNVAVAIKAAMKRNVEVTTLLNEIDRIHEAIGEDNTPRLLRAFDNAYSGEFLSEDMEKLIRNIAGASSEMNKDNVLGSLAEACDVCARELRSMRSLVNKDTVEVILKENIEMKHGYILHFLASAEFINHYMRTLMIVMTELESAAYRKHDAPKGTRRYLGMLMEGRRITALTAFVDFLLKNKKEQSIEAIYKMPPLDVDEDTVRAVTTTEGAQVIDPANLQFTSVIGNLLTLVNPVAWIYGSQKLWSEFLMYRLEENENELKYLELRHQELIEQKENGGTTVATAKSIERYQDEIVRIRSKIKRIRGKLEDE